MKDSDHPSGAYVRCPGCGGIVQMPCLACFLANGNAHLDCVKSATERTSETEKTRKCVKCLQVLPVSRFGGKTYEDAGVVRIRYRTCRSCRVEIDNNCHNTKNLNKEFETPEDE
jgi:hypothetical protein